MPKKRKIKLQCCEKCQNYWTCETKWYRGEHNQENICCTLCNSYEVCWSPIPMTAKKKVKKI